jgi:hypothetical protein
VQTLKNHAFLVIGLAALCYFLVVDIENLRPGAIDYAIFVLGFISMAIYVAQVFRRLRNRGDRAREEAP